MLYGFVEYEAILKLKAKSEGIGFELRVVNLAFAANDVRRFVVTSWLRLSLWV